MALIDRVSRLLTADIHAVLDRLEEPEALLKQALREMEEAVERAEQRVHRLEAERDAIAARARRADEQRRGLDAELDVCLDAGNDELARKLIRRKLEGERFGEQLAERLAAIEQALSAERATLAEQREELDALRQKAELFVSGRPASVADEPLGGRFAITDDEVELALLRERQRRKPS